MKKEEIIDKVGNTLIYLADNMPSLSKTKALKIVYLLDEFSIYKYGIPFFNLEYEVWKFGPVNQEIYSQLDSNEDLASLKAYICINKNSKGSFIKSIKEFADDEFSSNDLALLELISNEFKNKNADSLVEITHRKDGLWYTIVSEKGLLQDFENGIKNTSNYKIDFHKLVEHDKVKSHLLKEYEEMQHFSNGGSF